MSPESAFIQFRRTGEARYLAEVYEQLAPSLKAAALTFQPSDAAAEDLVHTAFLRAMQEARTWRKQDSLGDWMGELLADISLGLPEEPRLAELTAEPTDPGDPASFAMAGELSQALDSALRTMPESYRDVFELRSQGCNAREIGDQLGRSAATVRSQWSRALQHLRERLPLAILLVPFAATPVAKALRQGLRPTASETKPLPSGPAPAPVASLAKVALVVLAVGAAAGLWYRTQKSEHPLNDSMQAAERTGDESSVLASGPSNPAARIAVSPESDTPDAALAAHSAAPEQVQLSGRLLLPDGGPAQGRKLLLRVEPFDENMPMVDWDAETDAAGEFAFAVPAPGDALVSMYVHSEEGYLGQAVHFGSGLSAEPPLLPGRRRLAPLQLVPAAHLEGTLTRAGQSAEGAWLCISNGEVVGTPIWLFADAHGALRTQILAAGTHEAAIGFGLAAMAIDPLSLTRGDQEQPFHWNLPDWPERTFQVLDLDGRPLEGASVQARLADLPWCVPQSAGRTDAEGRITLATLGDTPFTVRALFKNRPGDWCELRPGQDGVVLTAAFAAPRTLHIAFPEGYPRPAAVAIRTLRVRRDGDGDPEFHPVQLGDDDTVQLPLPTGARIEVHMLDSPPLVLDVPAPGAAWSVEWTAPLPARLRLEIDGQPAAGLQVECLVSVRGAPLGQDLVYWTTLDNEGGLWWEPAWESLQARLGDRAVGFRAEGPLPEVLSLQPGATVRGVVRSAAGSIPGGLWLHLNSKESAIKTQIADDGSFELRGLPAGESTLVLHDSATGRTWTQTAALFAGTGTALDWDL
ncbi:MAG: sigma-70 family RNA polymerase sigma factor [Planctomycetota bacterium]